MTSHAAYSLEQEDTDTVQIAIHNFLHNWLCKLYRDNHPGSKGGSPYLTALGQRGSIDQLKAAIEKEIITRHIGADDAGD